MGSDPAAVAYGSQIDIDCAMLTGMAPDTPLAQVTLEHFRRDAAGQQPMPAGVAIAAVSASFALGLIAKVLAIGGRRDAHAEHAARIEPLAAAARSGSQRMLQIATEDAAAFEEYLAARRPPHSAESEGEARERKLDSSIRRVIDLPLCAADEAAAALEVCREASAFAPVALAADLGVAAALLAGALRAFLLCAQSNVRQLAPDAASFRERLASATTRHESALRQGQECLRHAESAVGFGSAPGGGG